MDIPAPSQKNDITRALAMFKRVFLTVGLFSATSNLLMLVPSLYMLQIYDRVLASRNEMTLLMLTVIMLGAYLLMSVLDGLRSFILIRVGAAFDMQLNRRIYSAAFRHNLAGKSNSAGQSLADLVTVRQFLTGNGMLAFFDAPWFPVYLIVIFAFQSALGWFAVGGTVVLIALAFANERVSRAPLASANAMAIDANIQATNNLRQAEVIQAMGMLPLLQERWFALHCAFLKMQARASQYAGVVAALTKFVQVALQSLVLGFGALLVLEGQMSAGMMIAASILVGRALAPVQQLIGVWKSFSTARSAYLRLQDLLAAHPLEEQRMALPDPSGAIALHSVSAMPPGAPLPVLKDVSIEIAAGDVIGVIGPSGAGKSTLARVLVGVWLPVSGEVRLDGAALSQWDTASLGQHFGYVPQEVGLFAGSIAENIARFGQVDSKAVVAAAQQAGVHELIVHLPQGYDTMLGDGGRGLSSGQRQRLGLARALYGDPALIVLDEPNSNLDEEGERALVAAVEHLRRRGKTVVLITHRRNVLSVTNKLLHLREGRIVHFGATQHVANLLQQAAGAFAQQRPAEEAV